MKEPYKIGIKTTDVMLEILNLDKKEVISIDGISNLEFDQVIKLAAYVHVFLQIECSFLLESMFSLFFGPLQLFIGEQDDD